MDPDGERRPAITGRARAAVWDFLPIKQAKKAKLFTEFPHLTLGIQQPRVLVIFTLPNGIRREFRNNLLNLGEEGFYDLILGIATDMSRRLQKAKGAKPWIDVVQRHFPNQRSAAIVDARVEFDLRTALAKNTKKRKTDRAVKSQPEWLEATFRAWSKKRSNLQIGVGAVFPYTCDVLRSRDALKYIAATRLACKPLLNAALGKQFTRHR